MVSNAVSRRMPEYVPKVSGGNKRILNRQTLVWNDLSFKGATNAMGFSNSKKTMRKNEILKDHKQACLQRSEIGVANVAIVAVDINKAFSKKIRGWKGDKEEKEGRALMRPRVATMLLTCMHP